MNYYPHHISDYKAATAHLSDLEDLAYRRLLEMYYDTERPIPADTQWVSRRIRMGSDVVELVLKDFFVLTENGYSHSRCDMEIREYNLKAQRSRENGAKGGRRKANNHAAQNPAGSQQEPVANPEITQSLANHKPLTNNQSKEKALAIQSNPIPKKPPALPVCPHDVDEQVWNDWLALRKAKRAAVSRTVIEYARTQAQKADMTFEDFLRIWCARGSQGMEASWITPSERKPTATSGVLLGAI